MPVKRRAPSPTDHKLSHQKLDHNKLTSHNNHHLETESAIVCPTAGHFTLLGLQTQTNGICRQLSDWFAARGAI